MILSLKAIIVPSMLAFKELTNKGMHGYTSGQMCSDISSTGTISRALV